MTQVSFSSMWPDIQREMFLAGHKGQDVVKQGPISWEFFMECLMVCKSLTVVE